MWPDSKPEGRGELWFCWQLELISWHIFFSIFKGTPKRLRNWKMLLPNYNYWIFIFNNLKKLDFFIMFICFIQYSLLLIKFKIFRDYFSFLIFRNQPFWIPFNIEKICFKILISIVQNIFWTILVQKAFNSILLNRMFSKSSQRNHLFWIRICIVPLSLKMYIWTYFNTSS